MDEVISLLITTFFLGDNIVGQITLFHDCFFFFFFFFFFFLSARRRRSIAHMETYTFLSINIVRRLDKAGNYKGGVGVGVGVRVGAVGGGNMCDCLLFWALCFFQKEVLIKCCPKGVYFERKEFASLESKFFPFKVEPFSKRTK